MDPSEGEFGNGGLGRFVPDIRFRVLILPGDPERYVVDFNDEVRGWWMRERRNPFDQRTSEWGAAYQVSMSAAIRHSGDVPGKQWCWHEYLALHRSGGIEFGSSRHAVYNLPPDISVFRLIYMTGRLWSMLDVHREVVDRFAVEGPWELSVALCKTQGAYLGHVGKGWQEPSDAWSRSELLPCPESHVLITREVAEWPAGEMLRDLVFSVAGNVEDTWGFAGRRFLDREGQISGQFDSGKYR
jgi:hypothetical protein